MIVALALAFQPCLTSASPASAPCQDQRAQHALRALQVLGDVGVLVQTEGLGQREERQRVDVREVAAMIALGGYEVLAWRVKGVGSVGSNSTQLESE